MNDRRDDTKGSPSAADAHLMSAAEALRMWLADPRGDALGGNRVATMMVALAAEGYVNAALMSLLSSADFDGVDRMSTPEKYIIALGYAHPGLKLERDKHGAGTLISLFRTRNDLTHSKAPEERSLFPPRAMIGDWIGVVASIVSRWHDDSGGAIPEAFSIYTQNFAQRLPDLKSNDGVKQLEALADAIDACSPLDMLMKPREAPPGALSIIRTQFPAAPREPLWITHYEGSPKTSEPIKEMRA